MRFSVYGLAFSFEFNNFKRQNTKAVFVYMKRKRLALAVDF